MAWMVDSNLVIKDGVPGFKNGGRVVIESSI